MELIWSKSRVRRFKRCRREYFIHHYASAGGFAPEADKETGELWFYKNLQTADYYIHRLMRKMLYRAITLKRSAFECRDELMKYWSLDMAEERITFYEQVYRGMTFGEARDAASEKIIRAGDILCRSELGHWLNRANYQSIFIDLPLEFNMRGVTVYTAPFAMLNTGGKYLMLELAGERMYDTAALHRYYAFHFRHIRPELLRSCFYNLTTGENWTPEFDDINFSATAAAVYEESELLSAAIPDEVIARRAYFAVSGAPRELCANCNFAKVCRQN